MSIRKATSSATGKLVARLIGMDEAGLGPNLGPFVVSVTVWDVPGDPRQFDFWQSFSEVLSNESNPKDRRLHIADSKQVYQPHRGLNALEHGVLSALQLIGQQPRSYAELLQILRPEKNYESEAACREFNATATRWYEETGFELPSASHDFSVVEDWLRACGETDARLVAIKAAVIEPQQFNQLIRQYNNKSLVVSRVAFRLLRSVWNPDETEAFIVGDKHGGRNRYDDLLAEVVDDEMIYRLVEGAERSDYRVGKTVLRFQPRAEEYGPVALASMTAKYVRELAMMQFNQFWARHVPGIKPTQGYPVDAKRFRLDIVEAQRVLGISDDELWRNR